MRAVPTMWPAAHDAERLPPDVPSNCSATASPWLRWTTGARPPTRSKRDGDESPMREAPRRPVERESRPWRVTQPIQLIFIVDGETAAIRLGRTAHRASETWMSRDRDFKRGTRSVFASTESQSMRPLSNSTASHFGLASAWQWLRCACASRRPPWGQPAARRRARRVASSHGRRCRRPPSDGLPRPSRRRASAAHHLCSGRIGESRAADQCPADHHRATAQSTRRPPRSRQQPPAFQINRLTIQGTTRESYAELDVDVEVTVLLPVEGEATTWTAVPLRFHDASLLAPPEYEGDGQLHVGFDAEAGYQGWLRHQRPGDHRIKLKLAVPLGQAAESTELRFFPPLANQSQFELRLPGTGISADIENARNLTVEVGADGQSTLRADDLRNQVVVRWRQGGTAGGEPPTYLDVRGDIRVTIDGPGAIRSNATLDLQSYGRPIEQFSLRLPPNTKIVSGNQPGYTISELTNVDGVRQTSTARRSRSNSKNPRRRPACNSSPRRPTAPKPVSTVNVASFEVIGAIRQSGRVSLLTSEEWLVYWALGPSVRRVQNLETFRDHARAQATGEFPVFSPALSIGPANPAARHADRCRTDLSDARGGRSIVVGGPIELQDPRRPRLVSEVRPQRLAIGRHRSESERSRTTISAAAATIRSICG